MKLRDTEKPFQPVVDAFSKMIDCSHGGGALCIYHKGRCVVDIWGGYKGLDASLWQRDTMALCFSATKGIVATLLHKLADQGLVRYDDPVAKYWADFQKNGKKHITLRQVLNHQSGLFSLRALLNDSSQLQSWDYVVSQLEGAFPDVRFVGLPAYHALTFGWIIGSIIERVTGQKFSQVLQSQLVEPLGLDGLFIGLPSELQHRYAAPIFSDTGISWIEKSPLPLISSISGLFGFHIDAILSTVPKNISGIDLNSSGITHSPIPSFNGISTARSLAKMYSVLANGGEYQDKQWIGKNTVQQFYQSQVASRDRITNVKMGWRLGYHQLFSVIHAVPRGFGHFGFGGLGGWAEPDRRLAMGFVINSNVTSIKNQLRCYNLTQVLLKCIRD